MGTAVHAAARVRPPSQGNKTHTACLAAATATLTFTLGDGSDAWINVTVNAAHNITFSDADNQTAASISTPANNSAFPSGYTHSYELGKYNGFAKVTCVADATITHWRSSRT